MTEPRQISVSFPLAEGGAQVSGPPRATPLPDPAPITGPELPRLTVAVTFDHDAISCAVERGEGPFARSRGEYGVRVGVPRVLAMLARHEIRATFFVPGHTAVSFPGSVASIVAGGHELACHGWAHEDSSSLDPRAERDLLVRSREAIARAWGRPPVGFRAPYFGLSERTLELAEEAGFAYDSSLAWDDFRLSRVRHGDQHAKDRSTLGPSGRLVEVPISHLLGDWAHFDPAPGAGGGDAPSAVEETWLAELRYAHAHVPGGVITFTLHPEVIGRGSRIAMLERLIVEARKLPGVVFSRLDVAVAGWLVTHEA